MRDKYLKWICGFANAQGGKIYIGMNDDGHVVGVSDSKKLLEDNPNKVQTTMGIQKICEACKQHGMPEPEYTVLGGDITVKFTALKRSKAPKPHDDALEKRMLAILKENSKIKQADLVSALGSSRATVQRMRKD